MERLRAENIALQRDKTIVGDSLRDEAEVREWCAEYNEFVNRLNRNLSTPWLELLVCEEDDD